jgi:hypothetical protein
MRRQVRHPNLSSCPRKAGIQYAVTPELNTSAAAYWIIRIRG